MNRSRNPQSDSSYLAAFQGDADDKIVKLRNDIDALNNISYMERVILAADVHNILNRRDAVVNRKDSFIDIHEERLIMQHYVLQLEKTINRLKTK